MTTTSNEEKSGTSFKGDCAIGAILPLQGGSVPHRHPPPLLQPLHCPRGPKSISAWDLHGRSISSIDLPPPPVKNSWRRALDYRILSRPELPRLGKLLGCPALNCHILGAGFDLHQISPTVLCHVFHTGMRTKTPRYHETTHRPRRPQLIAHRTKVNKPFESHV